LRVNLVPETFTKPVWAGTEAVEVEAVLVLEAVDVDTMVVVPVVVVTVLGTHWKKKGFWTTHADPAAQAVGPVQFSPPH
jgi:hypothetical protein